MTEGETTRLIAWSRELRSVHARLREALALTRAALAAGEPTAAAGRDLVLFCHGFCVALTGHHRSEDGELFPVLATAHPELRATLQRLEQDHTMMSHLIGALEDALTSAASPADLDRHVEGLAAIMENHFRYEERELLAVLETLELDADPHVVLGPL
ncbi:MAG TPA: hemerythrin domain-containing protein [Microbacterium sp.]|nr:hemerythrin domain-containing protein [Microbacterium sp.]